MANGMFKWPCIVIIFVQCMFHAGYVATAWNTPIATCAADNSWWWAQKMPKTCRVSWQNNILDTCGILLVIYTKMANNFVRKCSIYRSRGLLQPKRNLISVECGMEYHTPKTTILYQTPSPRPFHYLISIHKATKLCLSTQTPNHLVWVLFLRNILPLSSDSLLKMQAAYSSKTLPPGPNIILI